MTQRETIRVLRSALRRLANAAFSAIAHRRQTRWHETLAAEVERADRVFNRTAPRPPNRQRRP